MIYNDEFWKVFFSETLTDFEINKQLSNKEIEIICVINDVYHFRAINAKPINGENLNITIMFHENQNLFDNIAPNLKKGQEIKLRCTTSETISKSKLDVQAISLK